MYYTNSVLKKIYKPKVIGITLFILITVLLYIISTFGFFHWDQIANSAHSVIFWDSLLHGRILNAYQDAIDIVGSDKEHYNDWPLCYEPVSYFILGIINFPAIILYELGKLKFSSFSFCLFVKLQQIFMVFIASAYAYKISYIISEKNDKSVASMSTLMFLSCPGLIYFSIIFGQIEIYAITFSLIGIYYWLKKDNTKFVFFFAISITFKMFAFLIFVPLVLVRQKSLLRIIIYCYSGLFLLIISKLLYYRSDAYVTSLMESQNRIKWLVSLNSSITAFNGEHISTFIVCALIIFLLAYIYDPKQDKRQQKDCMIWAIYYCFLMLAVLFILVPPNPYWIVIITPFIPLLSAADQRKRNINIVLSLVFWCSYLFLSTLTHGFLSNYWMTERMLIPNIFGFTVKDLAKYMYMNDFLKEIGLDKYSFLANATYIGTLIGLCIINCPKISKIYQLFNRGEHLILIGRAMVIVPIMIGLIYIYYKQNDVLIDTTNMDGEISSYNIFKDISNGNKDTFRQILTFADNYKINKIAINLSSSGQNFTALGSIVIKLMDDFSGNEVFSKKIGYNEITNGQYTKIKVPGLIVNKNTNYSLIIAPDRYMSAGEVYVGVTKNKALNCSLLYYGHDTGRSLLLKINGEKYIGN